jgi:8-oxo-dGTP diphosphatase
MILVVAALIEREGRLLVCQRRKNDSFPLKWEFPGGKLKPGESPAEALARELKEELGADAAIGPEIYRTRHRYAEHADEIELYFFLVKSGAVANLAFEQIQWAEPATLPAFDFLPADRELINLLASGALTLRQS